MISVSMRSRGVKRCSAGKSMWIALYSLEDKLRYFMWIGWGERRRLFSSFFISMSVTYQPSKVKRRRAHGFRSRMKNPTGRALLARRRRKGRARLAV